MVKQLYSEKLLKIHCRETILFFQKEVLKEYTAEIVFKQDMLYKQTLQQFSHIYRSAVFVIGLPFLCFCSIYIKLDVGLLLAILIYSPTCLIGHLY